MHLLFSLATFVFAAAFIVGWTLFGTAVLKNYTIKRHR